RQNGTGWEQRASQGIVTATAGEPFIDWLGGQVKTKLVNCDWQRPEGRAVKTRQSLTELHARCGRPVGLIEDVVDHRRPVKRWHDGTVRIAIAQKPIIEIGRIIVLVKVSAELRLVYGVDSVDRSWLQCNR